jgi:TolB-like protein
VTQRIITWSMVCLALAAAPPASAAANLEEGVRDLAQQISVNMVNANLKKVALVEFAGLDGEVTAFGQFLAEELTTQLFVVTPGRFEVVERRQLQRVLQEHRLSASGLLDAGTIASLGKILGIEALITGSIADLGPEVKVNARLIAVESARVLSVPLTGRRKRAAGFRSGGGTLPGSRARPPRLRPRPLARRGRRRPDALAAPCAHEGVGWATLTSEIEPAGATESRLTQTERFGPRDFPSLVYWCAVLPLHGFVFAGMLRGMRRYAERERPGPSG